jgi:hypothetical protein
VHYLEHSVQQNEEFNEQDIDVADEGQLSAILRRCAKRNGDKLGQGWYRAQGEETNTEHFERLLLDDLI